ncbi:hypothetical protein [Methanobacterium alcaliphilum]|uniref:hypothetical protein n=1 Tax=Methanobacterium alcaliphilum TaxID=392018 RepID=UPI002009F471|nr:hypothetical protein [Methanobacterium alcaliphilum]MCK9151836.1 hypothetical protein [Methanobacterium alcaliphilum]
MDYANEDIISDYETFLTYLILLYAPETGIMRDINTENGFCGAYCFHDSITEMANDLFNAIFNSTSAFEDWAHAMVDNIVGYLDTKKYNLMWDSLNAAILGYAIKFAASPAGKVIPRFLGYVGIIISAGELWYSVRNHYIPMEYWQWAHHNPMWRSKTYTLCHLDSSGTPIWNEPTVQVEVPYKDDFTLDWDNSVYYYSTNSPKKVNSKQLKKLTEGYWWGGYGGFYQCPIP